MLRDLRNQRVFSGGIGYDTFVRVDCRGSDADFQPGTARAPDGDGRIGAQPLGPARTAGGAG